MNWRHLGLLTPCALLLVITVCFTAVRPADAQAAAPGANTTTNSTCDTDVSRTPWGIPSLLFGTPAGLLSPGNATYSDVVLCCGGTLDFRWSRPHGIWQLRTGTCPATFTNNPTAGSKQLVAVTDAGSATLRFPSPGVYFITSQHQDDCTRGMLFRINVPTGISGQCTNGVAGSGSGGNGVASMQSTAGG